MAAGGLNPALAWAHFQVRGGLRNTITTTIVYAAIISALIIVTLRIEPDSARSALQGWTAGLLALQAGALLLGCNAVRGAIRKDLTGRMIESHRLMPVGASWAVAGYVLGAAAQVLAIAVANLIIGTVTTLFAGLALEDWLLANAVCLGLAISLWLVVAYYSFLTKAGLAVSVIFFIVLWSSSGAFLSYFPATLVLLSPVSGESIMGILMQGSLIPGQLEAFGVGFLAQAALGVICFLAAQRKYLREDQLSIGPLLGLLLVLWWIILSIWGLQNWEVIQPRWLIGRHESRDTAQDIVSACAAMLLTAIPMAGAAWECREYRRRRLADDADLPPRPVPIALLAFVLTAVLMLLPLQTLPDYVRSTELFLRTAVVFVCFLISCGYCFRLAYRRNAYPVFLTVMWIGAMWAGPWMVDSLRTVWFEERGMSSIVTCSPIGALGALWSRPTLDTTPGLIFQICVMLFLVAVQHLLRGPRTTARPAPPSVLEPMPRNAS